MKLFYSLALLLMLHSLQQVSSIPDSWLRSYVTENILGGPSDPDSGFSGDKPLILNQTSPEFNSTSIATQTNVTFNSTIPQLNISELFTTVIPVPYPDVLNNNTTNQNETYPPSNTSSTTLSPEGFNNTENTDVNVTTAAPTEPANFTQAFPTNDTNTTLPVTTVSFTIGNNSDVIPPKATPTTEPKTTTTTTTTTIIFETTSEQSPVWPFDTTTSSNKTLKESVRENFNIDAGATREKSKSQAWGVFLGFCIVVGLVAVAIYAIKKRRSYRDFSHRKLVEEPVLRLDNSEPLDLKYDGSAYYNPRVQGDSIQMTNFPQGQYSC